MKLLLKVIINNNNNNNSDSSDSSSDGNSDIDSKDRIELKRKGKKNRNRNGNGTTWGMLCLLSWSQLQERVTGAAHINLDILKRHTRYEGIGYEIRFRDYISFLECFI